MIKWISDCLGTASHDQIYDKQGLRIIDVRDLVDKPGNLPVIARDKIDQAVASLQTGEKVVICCDYGISRSNAIAAGVLSIHQKLTLDDAVRRVVEATGETEIKIEVLSAIREALDPFAGSDLKQSGRNHVLVTGAGGFVGKVLTDKLQWSHSVYAPPRQELDLTQGAVKLDLAIREHEIGCVVHLANPRVFNTNLALGETLLMLKNVLDVCRENRLRLIYVSSWEVFSAYTATEMKASEDLPPHPKGLYGETKFLCEQLIEQHIRNHGVRAVLLRSATVYGSQSERPKFILNFMSKAADHRTIVTHKYLNGLPVLDLLHVDDLAQALVALIDSEYTGTLHVGSGRGISTTDVAMLIVKILESRSKIEHSEVQDYAPKIVMDYTRAQSVIRWQPRINFEDGLRNLLQHRMAQTERR